MKPHAIQVAELPTANVISYLDQKKLDAACDAFMRRRGLYIEPAMCRYNRIRREAKSKAAK